MKKAFMLVAAIAMLAAPVFAEITVSGEFEMLWSHEFTEDVASETYTDDNENSVELDLGVEVGEFTTVSMTFKAEPTVAVPKANVAVDAWKISQDITGALGMDGAVDVTVATGNITFDAKQYVADFHEFGEYDTDGNSVDFMVTLGLMDMLTVELGLYPVSYAGPSDDFDFGVNVYGVFGPVSIAASFVKENDAAVATSVSKVKPGDSTKLVDVESAIEVNALIDLAPVTVAAQVQVYDLEDDAQDTDMQALLATEWASDMGLTITGEYYVTEMLSDMDMDFRFDAEYVMGAVTLDANYDVYQILEATTNVRLMKVGAGVSYAASEVVELHVNYDITDMSEVADNMAVNVGSDLAIGAMSYSIDYTLATKAEVPGEDGMDHTVAVYAAVSF